MPRPGNGNLSTAPGSHGQSEKPRGPVRSTRHTGPTPYRVRKQAVLRIHDPGDQVPGKPRFSVATWHRQDGRVDPRTRRLVDERPLESAVKVIQLVHRQPPCGERAPAPCDDRGPRIVSFTSGPELAARVAVPIGRTSPNAWSSAIQDFVPLRAVGGPLIHLPTFGTFPSLEPLAFHHVHDPQTWSTIMCKISIFQLLSMIKGVRPGWLCSPAASLAEHVSVSVRRRLLLAPACVAGAMWTAYQHEGGRTALCYRLSIPTRHPARRATNPPCVPCDEYVPQGKGGGGLIPPPYPFGGTAVSLGRPPPYFCLNQFRVPFDLVARAKRIRTRHEVNRVLLSGPICFLHRERRLALT